MNKHMYIWDIECKNKSDYELVVSIPIDSDLLKMIFNKTKKRIFKQHKIASKNDALTMDQIVSWEIPKKFHGLVETSFNSVLRDIRKRVAMDRITILKWHIKECYYYKSDNKWKIRATFWGQYADNRITV